MHVNFTSFHFTYSYDVHCTEKKGYAIDSPTLVYMPHCDMELHEDILKDNSTVRNAILICNPPR